MCACRGEGSRQASAGRNTRRGRKAEAAARRWGLSNGREGPAPLAGRSRLGREGRGPRGQESPRPPASPHTYFLGEAEAVVAPGMRGISAGGSPLRHPKKLKKCRGRASALPLPPPPAPSPEAALPPPPAAAAVANLPLYPVPMVPPPRPATTQTQPRSPLYCPEAAAAARPAASPPAQPAPNSRERQHAAVSGPGLRQPYWSGRKGWPSLLARPSY